MQYHAGGLPGDILSQPATGPGALLAAECARHEASRLALQKAEQQRQQEAEDAKMARVDLSGVGGCSAA